MTRAYRPHPNGHAARAIAALQAMPPGVEIPTSELAERCGFNPQHAAAILAPAVAGQALVRRAIKPGCSRSPLMWSLGPIPPAPPPDRTLRKPAKEAKKVVFNASINADVSSRAVRLTQMRHPEAPKPIAIEPVITARTRITRGPGYTHDPRVQCAPGEQPFGAGFAACGIGRDIETGRAWR